MNKQPARAAYTAGTPEISVVVPLYNEATNVAELADRVRTALRAAQVDNYELLLVDDGSVDDTWTIVRQLHAADPHIGGVSFVRNFGHQNALFAGMALARGAAVITMDGDLQHPPECLPEMIARWREGFPVVATRRQAAENERWFKRTSSHWFYVAFSYVTELRLAPGSSDFRLLDRRVVEQLKELPDAQWFLRGMVQWLGFPTSVVDYQAARRKSGESKFGLRRMMGFASDAILSFSNKPLRLAIWMGAMCSLLALFKILYVLAVHLRGDTVSGWSTIIILNSFLFAALFFILGVMGAYLARIHQGVFKRPGFVIAQQLPQPHAGRAHPPQLETDYGAADRLQ